MGARLLAAGVLGLRIRPLLAATAVLAVGALFYFMALTLIVAAALSRLSTVHDSAAEYSVRFHPSAFRCSRVVVCLLMVAF